MPIGARAGTTGTLRGRVVDAATKRPSPALRSSASFRPRKPRKPSPTLPASFSFISLQPDTYTVNASKPGYDPQSQPGVYDRRRPVGDRRVEPAKDAARRSRISRRARSQSLVHSGVTSDVFSVNSAGQKAASTLSGSGSLTQAYGAIASAPGVNIPSNQQGWYQSVYIRGGDVDQVAYEFDGLPTTRAIGSRADCYAHVAGQSGSAGLYGRHAGDLELVGPRGLHQSGDQDRNVSGLCRRRLRHRRPGVLPSGDRGVCGRDARPALFVLRRPLGHEPSLSLRRSVRRR